MKDMHMANGTPLVRSLSEASVVIGGGTSGVGLASALHFAEKGVRRIALVARNPERGRRARDVVAEAHPDATVLFLETDADDVQAVNKAIDTAHAQFGAIDVLVSAIAATAKPDLLFRIPPEQLADQLTKPALPPIFLTRAVFPYMREQGGGVIINVASDASKIPTPGESVLGAAMAAVSMFSRGAALEGRRDGIRVNVITPSIIGGTPTTERWLSEGFGKKLFESAIKAAALGVVEPDELARLVVFLAGPDAAKITGQAISMNGGISIN
jgi:2-hydroxycyclohexanecarboxyl-CoA dehydrogenase